MIDHEHIALLPAGLHDVLPPDAAHEAGLTERLIAEFSWCGYERIKTPLVEFEESLLSGSGVALAKQTFRLMDPVSRRMMGVRSDMTPQIARIAATRLRKAPRPLRLCYAGQVLRVTGSQLRPERQFGQVGVELIGSLQPAADAEVILMGARALSRLGVRDLSVDLCVPTLVPTICKSLGLSEREQNDLRQALDHKDEAAVRSACRKAAPLMDWLLSASGPAERAVQILAGLELPESAEPDRRRLIEVVRLTREAAPEKLVLTVDLTEWRGFEYQTGVSFTFFARDVRGELGFGGRYRAGSAQGVAGEPATGFTLYADTVLRAVPAPAPARRLFVPVGTSVSATEAWRGGEWVTVSGLEPVVDLKAEARRLGCDHVLIDGVAVPLGESAVVEKNTPS
ncbi:ATP phosphoribosyltransferase regulatory subunit [Azospirillaceae bacterium]